MKDLRYTRLADVESMRLMLNTAIGREVKKVTVYQRKGFWKDLPKPRHQSTQGFFDSWCVGRKLLYSGRRGKYLLLGFDIGAFKISFGHYGLLTTKETYKKETKFVLEFSDGYKLYYSSENSHTGCVQYFQDWDTLIVKGLKGLGLDVIHSMFTGEHLYGVLNKGVRKDMEIGSALLLSTIVSGLDNDVRCNALFYCGISPHRKVKDIARSEIFALREELSFLACGSTQHFVWKQEGLCAQCGAEVKKEKHYGWYLYWCPGCQK